MKAGLVWYVLGFFAIILVTSGGFFAIGFFSSSDSDQLSDEDKALLHAIHKHREDKLTTYDLKADLKQVNRKRLRRHLRFFAKRPHLAGSERDEFLARFIRDKWRKYGLDVVELHPYEVLLSYPDKAKPNSVKVVNGGGQEVMSARHREDLGPDTDWDEELADAYLAYTLAGSAEANGAVYVNHGRVEDFRLLTDPDSEFYTDPKGKVCMMRFGRLFRGSKVSNAQKFGCVAALIFKDPFYVAENGTEPENLFPNTVFLPGSGMERGNSRLTKGDPDTPLWPSIPNAYRLEGDDLNQTLPLIPAQTLSMDDAIALFSLLEDKDVPSGWDGADGFPYTTGGQFGSKCPECTIRIATHNTRERKVSSNVIGIIKGEIEPDRYVILGSHRDAIGYGAVDPSSATAMQMELVRVLAKKMRRTGWRPRRTLVFVSWGAEEFGLIGSREFLEEFLPKLDDRTVMYINTDMCVSGPYLINTGSPHAKRIIDSAMQAVPSVEPDKFASVYDRTADFFQRIGIQEPPLYLPGAVTDSGFFIHMLGIPVLSMLYMSDFVTFPNILRNVYPTYHTAFENLFLVETLIDPEYAIHEACSRLNIALARQIGDSHLLDFAPEEYVLAMRNAVANYNQTGILTKIHNLNVTTDPWLKAIDDFEVRVKEWRLRRDSLNWEDIKSDPLLSRILNDQVMKLERAFLLVEGIPDQPEFRNAVLSASLTDMPNGRIFPGILDLVVELDGLQDGSPEHNARVKQLRKHISDLMIVLKQGADFLKEPFLL